MKRDFLAVSLALMGLGTVVGVIFILATIGSDTLRVLVLVAMGGCLVIGAILAGGWAASRILAAARPVPPVEKQTIVREVKVIDGRQQQPVLYQMPQQDAGAFPELLRAAYAAGRLELPGRSSSVPAGDSDDWQGDITG